MDMTILTDVGQRRTNNQDYANQYKNKAGKSMVFLADGMGGHRAGNIASEMAVTDLGAAWVSSEIETVNQVREWFAEHLEAVNRRIHLAGQDDEHKGMGPTLEALAFVEGQVIYAHVGDSRIGLIRHGEYQQLTSDHSLVNALLRAGQITEEEAAHHPQRNIITQSIGQKDELAPDYGLVTVEADDYILINSDGLTNMIGPDEIRDIVLSDVTLEEKAQALIRFANNAGGLDNITVVLLHFTEEDAA